MIWYTSAACRELWSDAWLSWLSWLAGVRIDAGPERPGTNPRGYKHQPHRTARLTDGAPQAMFVRCPQEVCKQKQGNAEGAV